MSSPLPVNAKQGYRENGSNNNSHLNDTSYLSSSLDRVNSTARLGTSPIALYGTSPKSVMSTHTYGSTDLDNVLTTNSGGLFRPLSTATFNPEDNTVSVDLPEDQVASIVKRHLVDTSPSASLRSSSLHRTGTNNNDDDPAGGSNVRSVHQLAGGAITHDIYKWADDIENEQLSKRQRSQSFHIPRGEIIDPALARLKDPGGFRRHFVVDKAARQGRQPPHWMTRTFVDFLALYGHFGGEDLSDDEGEDDDEDDVLETGGLRRRRRRSEESDEESPLIRRAQRNAVQGTATPAKAVFLLLKSFVGTGVMFLPKA